MSEPMHSPEEWRQLRERWSRSFDSVIEDLNMAKRHFKPKTAEHRRLQLSIVATIRHRETMLEVIDIIRGSDVEKK